MVRAAASAGGAEAGVRSTGGVGGAGGGRPPSPGLWGPTRGVYVLGSQTLHHSEIRFSQSSVNNVDSIVESMRISGWQGPPIDVVKMPDGSLATVDNTRLLAASRANICVKVFIHDESEHLSPELQERFMTKQGGLPSTWGEAILNRINAQNSLYRGIYPKGSMITGARK